MAVVGLIVLVGVGYLWQTRTATEPPQRISPLTSLPGVEIQPTFSPDGNRVPDFSVADVAIVLGVATLIVELLASEMAARATERAPRGGARPAPQGR